LTFPRRGAILIVEDEQPLLDLLASYLTRLGYEVEACAAGTEALRRFQEKPSSYALVLTDANIPDLSGQELIRRITKLKPEVRIVLTSGSSIDTAQLPPAAAARARFLLKPFVPAQLAQVIKDLLEG
jgi:two-component system cell cycle sensor histidine kinase/response regulator CckA